MAGRLDGKVAVITGAGSGIGAASARLFAREGARVLVTDMDDRNGESVASELGAAGSFLRADVSREDQVAAAVAHAVQRWGRLDVMFNNAGFGGATGPIEQISEDDFDLTVDVLLKGVFFGMKHAAPVMKAQQSGSIISTASVAAIRAGAAPHIYSAAKAAVVHLTRSVALELGESHIRVNAILPGYVPTPLIGYPREQDAQQLEELSSMLAGVHPIGRIANPDDIARAALFLASDDSTFITGTGLVVDGGISVGRPWKMQNSMMTAAGPITQYRPEGR